jgi:ribosomal protein S18 acetylase RimI-like enzyme
MQVSNKTSPLRCRFLHKDDFDAVHQKLIEAFADYYVPFELSERQFRNHLAMNAVDLERSIGSFDGDEMVGFTLNGFGEWNSIATVYDAGTGVIPAYRRRGISESMFRMMMPVFKERGFQQYLLEVITQNSAAINLYKKLGFGIQRELLLMENEGEIRPSTKKAVGVQIAEMPFPEKDLFTSFWDGQPSWQNSSEAVARSIKTKRLLGAFVAGKCVGYLAYSAGRGQVAQLAVNREYRRRGIGTRLLEEMRRETGKKHKLQVINLDSSITYAVRFFQKRGFATRLAQYEMIGEL